MRVADVRRFYRNIRGGLGAAGILLALDVGFLGSILMSTVFCPIWILVSSLRSAIYRPGYGLATARILIPVLTFLIVRVNDAVQLNIAEVNAQKVVAACESYHADNGRFPKKLDELVPQYMSSVPVAKYCLGPGRFVYSSSKNSGITKLFWYVVPPYFRKIYDFETRSWSYLG